MGEASDYEEKEEEEGEKPKGKGKGKEGEGVKEENNEEMVKARETGLEGEMGELTLRDADMETWAAQSMKKANETGHEWGELKKKMPIMFIASIMLVV
ncbi:hypothetical protein N0V88_006002 [Collariella sp. IMI 366227]|nr:hypothetical protein N0V88_006002 [Collariella sp. IMI 366227]